MHLIALKLGGSLLTCPDLADRLQKLWTRLSPSRLLLVVGGGTAADVVRDWSSRYSLPEESAHWMAVRSLTLTRSLICNLLPECREVTRLSDADAIWSDAGIPLVLDVESYLRQTEPIDPDPLPHTWDVTSDSIAAWAAIRWSADELILAKSTEVPPQLTAAEAAAAGLVDAHFRNVAPSISRIRWCNLANEELVVHSWLEDGKPVG
ncbi:MAG: hypothetical protein JSS49_15770 [Planctomycetes bacterium]|nr:hypothetical protein [Planctomycetota bacterium]